MQTMFKYDMHSAIERLQNCNIFEVHYLENAKSSNLSDGEACAHIHAHTHTPFSQYLPYSHLKPIFTAHSGFK